MGQEMIIGDILDCEKVKAAVEGCDVVYNFAALSDLNEALDKPLDTIRTNILGNANIMDACRYHGTKRFIYASTIYVNSRQGGVLSMQQTSLLSRILMNIIIHMALITQYYVTDHFTVLGRVKITACIK
jgi:nucleoside-diphosphate-sugar epimerase